MNLQISGHHLEVTPALREYVITKLDRVLRHFDQVIDGSVVLSVDNNHKEKEKRQKVEINLHLKGKDLFVESCDSDLYAAIDLMIDKLDRQVIRHKDRLQGHAHEAIKYQPAPQLDVPPQ
ncbi:MULTISPECIES: ribosome hibernation-promoting factor, HPF/YfiA family [Burkholderiaceae]|jgi:putative sigma-54 modulation protein|uniref:Ribosome hibernation promoting factor n=3 Tax=Paraburkholderia TaxID=1822464 RepID=Q145W2_PARXL|nr:MULTISPECIES: ribosome-associated translation inhibitor RaiA [Burkholderiaceae]EIF28650.1 ribosomal subunit interface protein [Burkholderia sp. Ch1-1]ABE28877.1 SSU ribosomal protein S30P [Paraburkholderia xenovorans LB400]AIP30772.1 ribosomal subunit interface protein [Paraburkholderia xenovorans LB400]ASV97277.1 ribosomal subunit interface protein [Paraburkholderia aromaticivorans]MDR8400389.1 ribosome-associated translation inhibitor RaiA [Paraburkholderia sp. USG1]